MLEVGEEAESYILVRVGQGQLQPVDLWPGSREQKDFARRVSQLRPLCVRTAIQYPGLLSIEEPWKACGECELRQSCGSVCVQTLGMLDTRADREYVVMHFEDRRSKTPDEEKANLKHLLTEVTGHPVALKQQCVAC